jgi:hypothetical protein
VGGSTEDPAQDVTFSGRTVKWQGVPVRRCALGRITVKAKTRIKVFAPGSGCDLRGPHRGVFRRDGKGPGGVMGIGCIPAVYARRASGQIRSRNCFHFCVMTLFIGAL